MNPRGRLTGCLASETGSWEKIAPRTVRGKRLTFPKTMGLKSPQVTMYQRYVGPRVQEHVLLSVRWMCFTLRRRD